MALGEARRQGRRGGKEARPRAGRQAEGDLKGSGRRADQAGLQRCSSKRFYALSSKPLRQPGRRPERGRTTRTGFRRQGQDQQYYDADYKEVDDKQIAHILY
jgi:hypothetical protein